MSQQKEESSDACHNSGRQDTERRFRKSSSSMRNRDGHESTGQNPETLLKIQQQEKAKLESTESSSQHPHTNFEHKGSTAGKTLKIQDGLSESCDKLSLGKVTTKQCRKRKSSELKIDNGLNIKWMTKTSLTGENKEKWLNKSGDGISKRKEECLGRRKCLDHSVQWPEKKYLKNT